jgi:cytochrome c5
MFARKFAVALCVVAGLGSISAQERGPDVIKAKCMACHGDDLIRQQRLTREGWSREVDKMIGWGAAVTSQERALLLDALIMAGRTTEPRTAIDPAATVLLEARCQVCHDLRMIDQQRLDAAGWVREIDKMIAWGAVVTPAEKAALVALLVQRRGIVLPYRP